MTACEFQARPYLGVIGGVLADSVVDAWFTGEFFFRLLVNVLSVFCMPLPVCPWTYEALLAGRRINFEGLVFASKAILRQNTWDPAICQLCLLFPLNKSKILEKGLIIPLR